MLLYLIRPAEFVRKLKYYIMVNNGNKILTNILMPIYGKV